MERGYKKVKQWFIDKQQTNAKRYDMWIDVYSRDDNGMIVAEDGYLTVMFYEVLAESEKAVQVILSTGDVVGSGKGWKCWVPKSCIA